MKRFIAKFPWQRAPEEPPEPLAPRRRMWCIKCKRETVHAQLEPEGKRAGWFCTEPGHWNERWRKAGDALEYLEREVPDGN